MGDYNIKPYKYNGYSDLEAASKIILEEYTLNVFKDAKGVVEITNYLIAGSNNTLTPLLLFAMINTLIGAGRLENGK